jgi:SnoaL-like domain
MAVGNIGQQAHLGQQAACRLYPAGVSDGVPGSAGVMAEGLAEALVKRYLRAVAAQDWETVATCLSPAVVRRGPFGDDFEGRKPYLEFLRRTMPALPGYEMALDRVTAAGVPRDQPARRVFAELRETVVVDREAVVTEECLVFEIEEQIESVSVYIRRTA